MKKRYIGLLIAGAAVVLLGAIGWGSMAHAQNFRSGDNTTIRPEDKINSTLYATGRTIDIAGQINGDVICAGQTVTITGRVSGDVICAAQSIHVLGDVEGDVRLAGQTVIVGGAVSGNASVLAQTFTTEGNSRIDGDIGSTAQDVTLNGSAGRDIAVNSQQLTVNGAVERDVQTNAKEEVRLGRDARVGGGITYASMHDLQRDNGATVAGNITRHDLPARHSAHRGNAAFAIGAYIFVSLLVISMVLVLLTPRLFDTASAAVFRKPGRAALAGLVASLAVPAIITVLIFTIVGIPLALLVLLAWFVALTVAGPMAAYMLGRVLIRNSRNAVLIMLVGSIVLLLLYFVPFVNFIVLLAVVWFGLGALVLATPHLQRPGYQVTPANEVIAKRDTKAKRE